MSTVRPIAPGTKVRLYFCYMGTTFTVTSAWTEFIGVTGVPGPDMAADNIDMTEIDPYSEDPSTTTPATQFYSLFKIFKQGWKDGNEVTMECNLTQQMYSYLATCFQYGFFGYFAVHFRNGYAFVGWGYVSGLGQNANEGSVAVKMPVTFKLSGAPGFLTHTAANNLAVSSGKCVSPTPS
jgi:hypothetical protein